MSIAGVLKINPSDCTRITVHTNALKKTKYNKMISGTYVVVDIDFGNNNGHDIKCILKKEKSLEIYIVINNDEQIFIIKKEKTYPKLLAVSFDKNIWYIVRSISGFKRFTKKLSNIKLPNMKLPKFKLSDLIDISDLSHSDKQQSEQPRTGDFHQFVQNGGAKINSNEQSELQTKVTKVLQDFANTMYINTEKRYLISSDRSPYIEDSFRSYNGYFVPAPNNVSDCNIVINNEISETQSSETQSSETQSINGGKLNRRTMRRHKKTHRKQRSHNRKTK